MENEFKVYKKISIIIITYNEEENIINILKDLKNQTFKNFEIIISDSNSTDNTELKAQTQKKYFKEFKFKNFKKTLGPSYGRNFGVKMSKYELILFLDSDSRIKDKSFLQKFIDYTNKYKIDGGGFYLNSSEKKINAKLGFFAMNLVFFITQYFSPTTFGACMFASRKMHNSIDGFRENVTFGEDSDYIRDGKRKKFKIRILPMKFEFSERRFIKEGFIKIEFIYLKVTLTRFITGKPFKEGKIKYEFGNYKDK